MTKDVITCATWEEIGPALDAGLRPIIGFTCGLCGQRVAEEFHSLTMTTYHRVAEEECERLRAALAAAETLRDGANQRVSIVMDAKNHWQGRALAAEAALAVDRTRDGVIDAARAVEGHYTHLGTNNDLLGLLTLIHTGLRASLAGYDAAVAENRAHDSLADAEPTP